MQRLRQVNRVSDYEYEVKYLALGYKEGEMLDLSNYAFFSVQ
jgi:hypothetical protein